MLNVALATMTRALGASQTDQHWIIDGYTVALAALLLFAEAARDL
jgi:NaMN:DMB phosphoribosyltransferase